MGGGGRRFSSKVVFYKKKVQTKSERPNFLCPYQPGGGSSELWTMSKVSQGFSMASLRLHERTERQPKTQMFDKIYKVLMNPNWMKLTLREPNQNPFSRSDFIHRMNSTDMIWGFLTKFCKLAVMIMFNTHNYTADQWGWGGSRKILQNIK